MRTEGVVVSQERALGSTIWTLSARCSRCGETFLVARYGPGEWVIVEELLALELVNPGPATRCPRCIGEGH